ncbi:MAG: hypothetical protein WB502_13080 [Thermoactinomyces sp.]
MYRSDRGQQMKYLRKAHYYCQKACEYMEKAMRSSPCDGDCHHGYERCGDGRWPSRRYGEYRRNPYHMDSSSWHTYAEDEHPLEI